MLLSVLKHWIEDRKWIVDVLHDIHQDVPSELAATGVNVFSSANPKDYDFAIVNTIVSANFLESLGPQVPTVLWVHEGETVLWTSQWRPAQWRHLFGLPQRIIFQSRWQSESVFRSFLVGTPQGRVSCVANGMPSLPANLVPKPKVNHKKRIVFIGGVYGRKRPQDLVDAVLGLDRNDVECLFIGTTDGVETIGDVHIDRIRSRPDIFQLLGELDRRTALEYLISADAFCLPSGDESQPIAPLEAASLRVPCALTDLPPYAGSWVHGHNCLLSPVGDSTLLRWNIRALLDDPSLRNPIVERAIQFARQFAIESFFQRFDAEMPSALDK